MHSSIYTGNVRHHRFTPTVNSFNYSLYLLYLDLDELESVFDRNWLWSTRRFNFAWFRTADHLGTLRKDTTKNLKQLIRSYLHDNGIEAGGPIRLLTQVRYLGFAMNPASFFYCYDTNENLRAIVTQVNNTPWGEEHLYLIDAREPNNRIGVDGLKKDFHVSPFMPMEMNYDMRFTPPDEKLAVRMTSFESGTKMLNVVMSLKRKKLNSVNLNRLLLSYPLMSMKVFAAIYWQALKLYLKKVPFYSHPKKQNSKSKRIQKPHTIRQNAN